MIGINDLPADDIFPFIFRYLPIEDLFNCRLVNKKFKNFSDHSNHIYKLVLNDENEDDSIYWHHSGEKIQDKDVIKLKLFKKITLLSIFNLEKNLKFLKIEFIDPKVIDKFKLSEISNLINLECLEVKYVDLRGKQLVNFDNLKIFMASSIEDTVEFHLNTPKLEQIDIPNLKEIYLKSNPESVKYIITDDYSDDLEIFKNLEILQLDFCDYNLNGNLLSIFKFLKRLRINFFTEINKIYNQIENSILNILKEKIRLKREIIIHLEGVQIINIQQFKDIKSYNSLIEYQIKNFNLLEPDFSCSSIDYSDLENFIDDLKKELPFYFFKKFYNLYSIQINEIRNIDNFYWFLENLSDCINLSVLNLKLNQNFFENLPDKISHLDFGNLSLDYNFILKLSKLESFVTEYNCDLFDLALKSFLKLKHIYYFSFQFYNIFVLITKSENLFKLELNSKTLRKNLDYCQLVNLCNEIRDYDQLKKNYNQIVHQDYDL